MKVSVLSQEGKEVKKIDLDKDIFERKVSDTIIAQYIFAYTSNQRSGNAHSKDRSEVSGGGRKPWKQKGTGRARHGSTRTPIWTKGGVSFGPRNTVNWKKGMNKKFKLVALSNVLSSHLKNGNLIFVDTISIDGEKGLTKKAESIRNNVAKDAKKVTVVTGEKKDLVIKAFSNLEKSNVVYVKDLSAYDIYAGGKVVIEESALEEITNKFKK